MSNSREPSNPIEVQKYLKGMDYPASKEELLDCAEDNHAPQAVIDAIKGLDDDQEYRSPTEITQQMKATNNK